MRLPTLTSWLIHRQSNPLNSARSSQQSRTMMCASGWSMTTAVTPLCQLFAMTRSTHIDTFGPLKRCEGMQVK